MPMLGVHNPAAPERSQVIGELQKISASGERERYAAPFLARDKVKGVKQAIYRADIDKTSGWCIHVQYIGGQIHLKDIIEGKKHDDVLDGIKSNKARYE
jgi:hypothetical protein